jgi:hypothetical protein
MISGTKSRQELRSGDPVAHKVTKNALCINSEAVFSFFNTVDAEASILIIPREPSARLPSSPLMVNTSKIIAPSPTHISTGPMNDDPVAHKVTKNALCINSEAVFSFFNTVDAEASIDCHPHR